MEHTFASSLFIITGASRGLGEALASLLLKPGNRLICISRSPNEALRREAEAAGACLEWVEQDLAALADWSLAEREKREGAGEGAAEAEAFMRRLLDICGDLTELTRIRLIHNAGVLEPIGPAHAISSSAVARHMAVNLTAPMVLTGAFLRLAAQLAADKRVLLISSGAGRKPYEGWSAYCAAKAGLDHFARCVKLEQDRLPYGARIVSVAPGVIDTGMQTLIRGTDEERFPSQSRFVRLFETGALEAPRDAAGRLLRLLELPDFGAEPVMDVRDLNLP